MEHYRTYISDSARWDGFRFRPGDIVISVPPKSGTTWMQMLCALLIFQDAELPKPLGELSPWLDAMTRRREDVVAQLDAQRHRRFIKSHTPLDGLPIEPGVTYVSVARDPRDVGCSWRNHRTNLDFGQVQGLLAGAGSGDPGEVAMPAPPPDDPAEAFRRWVDDDSPPMSVVTTLRSTLHHLGTFWEPPDGADTALFHYDDLLTDIDGQMRRLAAVLGIDVPVSAWAKLVEATSFTEMKTRAERFAPQVTERFWRDSGKFFNQGTSGQWRGLLDEDDLRHYERRVDELAPPDLAAWLHKT